MRTVITILASVGATALAPGLATAAPPSGGWVAANMQASTSPTTSPAGNGGGYNHTNSPAHQTGQPNQSCETTGTPPGNSASASGSAFNPSGTAGSKYAGQQPQNSRNTASVSQYDVACANQPH